MNSLKTGFAAVTAAAALAAGPALAVQGEPAEAVPVYECNGQNYSGNYIVKPNPSFAPLTVENFNSAAGEGVVESIRHGSGGLIYLTPANPANLDCNEFMEDIEDSGLAEYIEPDWIMTIQTPQP